MKILIDGQTLLTAELTRGIGKYFVKTLEQVLQYDFVTEFYLTTPANPQLSALSPWARTRLQVLANEAYEIRTGGDWSSHESRYSQALNDDIERLGIDVYWSPNALMDNVVLPRRESNHCKYAVTIFDLIPAVLADEYAKQWPAAMLSAYKEKLKRLETDFDLFLHISNYTESDCRKILNVENARHVVTHLGVDPAFHPYPFPRAPEANDYVIYPGGFDPRKNMERAVESFAELKTRYGQHAEVESVQLCIVCHSDRASESRLLHRARKLGIEGQVFLTGFVADSKLVELYQRASCLFFPSLYEGFGLPVLEGLACGLPVAAANTSSLPEVGAEFAVYFDPRDVSQMASGLREALRAPKDSDSKLRRYRYASSFSWKKTALATLDAFAKLVRESKLPRLSVDSVTETIPDPELIDVRQRMREVSVKELCETAETFFARLDDWNYLHAKPFAAVNETPDLLINFAHVVHGLNLLPDMTIMDFGAGSCWSSRFLSQLGLQVIAVDVSATALKIGQELYRRHPLIGNQPEPRFLHFDGHCIELPDESVDRISCWDAFHHVPNPDHVLKEMARVLKTGGIAGFSEPGPNHSQAPQSQYEMRTNSLIENDVNVDEIWMAAQDAGFTDIKVAVFNPKPLLRPLDQFAAYVDGTADDDGFLSETRDEMQHRRIFFLFKGEASVPHDSRQRTGLVAALQVQLTAPQIPAGSFAELHVSVTNAGTATWLPSTARVGGVRFGAHLFDENGTLIDLDYYRQNLPSDGSVGCGDALEFSAKIPAPPVGCYTLQCDLVSEGVCWFEHNGSPTVRLDIQVT